MTNPIYLFQRCCRLAEVAMRHEANDRAQQRYRRVNRPVVDACGTVKWDLFYSCDFMRRYRDEHL